MIQLYDVFIILFSSNRAKETGITIGVSVALASSSKYHDVPGLRIT